MSEEKWTCESCGHANAKPRKKPINLTGVQRVMMAYKLAKGVDKDNAGWDRANFTRYSRAAASILECYGGVVEAAVVCVLTKGEQFNERELSWNLDTIKTHAWDGIGEYQRQQEEAGNGLEHGKVDAGHLLDQGRPAKVALSRDLAGESLRRIAQAAEEPYRLEG